MSNGKGGFIGQDGLNAPDQATGVAGTGGDTAVSVAFTAPSNVGAADITGFRVQSNDGIGASGTSSPINVTGLTNGTSYTFNVWTINPFGYSSPSDASGSVTPLAAIALIARGQHSSGQNNFDNQVDSLNIATTGNSSDFGNLSVARISMNNCGSSSTRGIFAGGSKPSNVRSNVIDYFTIQSAGNATDFGNLAAANQNCTSVSSSTRSVTGGGRETDNVDRIQYVTIASTGNTTDFGNLLETKSEFGSTSSPTRGLFFAQGSGGSDDIEYITIASTGNSQDFGNMTVSCESPACCASNTRGLHGGGSGDVADIGYVTIASAGNASDFGDLTVGRARIASASSKVRGIFAGGYGNGIIDYITISTTGNATDFGDMSAQSQLLSACSSAHGGL